MVNKHKIVVKFLIRHICETLIPLKLVIIITQVCTLEVNLFD
jgi:hypothetical protein